MEIGRAFDGGAADGRLLGGAEAEIKLAGYDFAGAHGIRLHNFASRRSAKGREAGGGTSRAEGPAARILWPAKLG